MAMTKTQKERLERLLLVVPYILRRQDVTKHRGASVSEIKRRFRIRPRLLASDLRFLSSYISPGGGSRPDDYVDAYIEDDQAYIFGPLNFKGPMALRPREWFALLSAGEFMSSSASGPLGRGLQALAGRLQRLPMPVGKPDVRGKVIARPRAGSFTRCLETLRKGISIGKKVRFLYYSRSRDKTGERRVSPHGLFMLDGDWYLAASDAGGQLKTFRVDRMRGVKSSGGLITKQEQTAYLRWAGRGKTFDFRDCLRVSIGDGKRTAELQGNGPARLLDLYFRSYAGWRVSRADWFRDLVRNKLEVMLEAYR